MHFLYHLGLYNHDISACFNLIYLMWLFFVYATCLAYRFQFFLEWQICRHKRATGIQLCVSDTYGFHLSLA